VEWGVSMGENERNSINVTPEEYRKFFASYWFLHSALYNLAQGRNNQKKRRFTWAITNYYYSLVFVGRLYSFLVLNKYYRGHPDLAEFYKSNSPINKKVVSFNRREFIEERDTLNKEALVSKLSEFGITEHYLTSLGKELEALKDFRNSNTYEAFIIYGQELHSVITTFLFTATDTVRSKTEKFVKDACMVFYNYWYKKNREVFPKLIHHQWLIDTTLKSLKKQTLDSEYIETLINRGFYFENLYLLRQFRESYRRIYELQKNKTIPQCLQREFEKYCSIEGFKGKQNLIDKIHGQFLKLIK